MPESILMRALQAPLRDWRTKAVLQKVLSAAPRGHALNYVLQRRLTHGVPIDDKKLLAAVQQAATHLAAYKRHANPVAGLSDAKFFEFGAGWDLHMPLVFFAWG